MQYTPSPAPNEIEKRDDILKCYLDNQIRYLTLKYPNLSPSVIEEKVKAICKERFKRPTCEIIVYPRVGECNKTKMDLYKHLRDIGDKTIAPSGSAYYPSNKVKAMSTEYTLSLVLLRKKYKNAMFNYIMQGNTLMANANDNKQSLVKFKVNSIIGSSGTKYSAMYAPEIFGSITSIGRNGVVMTYGCTEQFLAGNYYFTDLEMLKNFIIVTKDGTNSRIGHDKAILATVKKHNLYIPTTKDICDSLTKTMFYYREPEYIAMCKEAITPIIENLKLHEKLYLFYRRNFFVMLKYNTPYWKEYLNDLFDTDKEVMNDPNLETVLSNTEPKAAKSLHGDILTMLTVIYEKYLNGYTYNDLVDADPHAAKIFSLIGLKIDKKLDYIEDILITFYYDGELFSNIPQYKHMMRNIVAVSDTDSILFTASKQVSWYRDGDMSNTKEALNMALFTIFVESQVVRSINRAAGIARGVVTEDNLKHINMKNEFLYPAFVKTCRGKHYFGYQTVKEGRNLPEPKLDKKGVGFQSSTLPAVSLQFTNNILKKILKDYMASGKLVAWEFIDLCLGYEHVILDSLKSGDLLYYTNASIKPKEEYADANRSIYFNYECWQEVFAPVYGDINIPGKFTLVPFKKNAFTDPKYLDWIEHKNKTIYTNLMEFMKKHPKKNITRMVLPATTTTLPEIFTPLIDARKIIYKNLAPAQLALESLGVKLGPMKKQPLFIDHYDYVASDSLNNVRLFIDGMSPSN